MKNILFFIMTCVLLGCLTISEKDARQCEEGQLPWGTNFCGVVNSEYASLAECMGECLPEAKKCEANI